MPSDMITDLPTAEAFDVIPHALKALPQWVGYRREERDGKVTKVPYSTMTRTRASVANPADWATFDEAMAAFHDGGFDGVGFVLTRKDPFTGIDLDHCIDPATGVIEPWALAIVDQLHSYTERSPSGTGLHIFVRGTLPPHGRKRGSIEFYQNGRYLSVTGNHLPGTPQAIEYRQLTLQRVHGVHFPKLNPNRNGSRPPQPFTSDDDTQLARMFASRHGAKILALWNGAWRDYFPSQSEADAALCFHLVFWFGHDPARIDRLFRRSGLMRDKWDSSRGERTYGARCIATACGMTKNTYEGRRHEGIRAVRKAIECSGSLHVEYL